MAESIVQVTEGTGKKLHTNSRTVGANTVEDEVVVQGLPFLATYGVAASGLSAATALSHPLQIMAGATLNVYVTRIRVFQTAVATTGALGRIFVHRLSTAGTGGTAVTPQSFDTTDAASGATAMTLPTVKGTEVSASPLTAGVVRFIQTVGATGAGQDFLMYEWSNSELTKSIRIPAGATNGIAVKNMDAQAAATILVKIEFFEASY